jgi:hypothetical protein
MMTAFTAGPAASKNNRKEEAMSELAFRRMPQNIAVIAASTALSAFALLAPTGPTWPAPLHPTAVHEQMKGVAGIVEVCDGCTAVGPRGYSVRPGWYWWPPGDAAVTNAAIRFVEPRNAPAYAGPQPAPATCWYYTEPSRIQGFWGYCPL